MTTTTQTPATTRDLPAEVVTHTPVQDVTLPGGAGVLALVTLDNGLDHTRPNTFGPQSIAELQAAVDTLRTRAEAGEIQAVGITGKPFIFAVGADLSGVPYVTQREQAVTPRLDEVLSLVDDQHIEQVCIGQSQFRERTFEQAERVFA